MSRQPALYRNVDGYYRATIDGHKLTFGRDYETAVARFSEALARSSYAKQVNTTNPVYLAVAADRWTEASPTYERRATTRLLLRFLAASGLTEARLGTLPSDLFVSFGVWMRGATHGSAALQYRPSTIATAIERLRKMLGWFVEQRWLAAIPEAPVKERGEQVYRDVPIEQLAEGLERLEQRNPHAARILRFVLFVGCRPGEARKLRWKHVDLTAGVCTLSAVEHKTGAATGRARTVYLTEPAIALLRGMPQSADPEALVFATKAGKAYSKRNLCAIARRLGFYPYQLRHTFAQNALSQQPLEVVSVLLGHADLKTTQIYAQIRSARATAAAKSLELPKV